MILFNEKISVMNKLDQLFKHKKQNLLSVYFTAGYPEQNDTGRVAAQLDKAGVDFIEIGFPFSDPVADGPVIQKSSKQALDNGMTVQRLFEQLETIQQLKIPRVLMGYINPVLQFGMEHFLEKCAETGVDGVILPDLPLEEYQMHYAALFKKHGIHNILLISPETPDERIQEIARLSTSFIYLVSSNAITGSRLDTGAVASYFERVKSLVGNQPLMAGFGIRDRATFTDVCQYTNGAIIGSAFIKALEGNPAFEEKVAGFVKSIKG